MIDNEIWTVKVDLVDLEKAQAHLKDNYVKYPSAQLNELISGKKQTTEKGFTSAFLGKYVADPENTGYNTYLSTLEFAIGVFWSCDAGRAIEKKARDIRGHLAAALSQLPEKSNCIIHVGLETHDGWAVEAERYNRIFDTFQKFDAKEKNLKWMYCHLFQPYAPPDTDWVIDETVYYYGKDIMEPEPLTFRPMIVEDSEESFDGVHWLRDPP